MKTINVRLPDELHGLLVKAAEEDVRSLNGEFIYLMRLALETRDRQK